MDGNLAAVSGLYRSCTGGASAAWPREVSVYIAAAAAPAAAVAAAARLRRLRCPFHFSGPRAFLFCCLMARAPPPCTVSLGPKWSCFVEFVVFVFARALRRRRLVGSDSRFSGSETTCVHWGKLQKWRLERSRS